MRLSDEAIKGIRASIPAQARLMNELNVSSQTIWRWTKENEANGNLTKTIAVKAIAEELDLDENSILEK